MSNIGELIAYKRKECGLTQKQLADKLHLSVSAISKWENDVSCPHFSLFHDLSNTLGLSVEELFKATAGDLRYISAITEITDPIPEIETDAVNSTNKETTVANHVGNDQPDILPNATPVVPLTARHKNLANTFDFIRSFRTLDLCNFNQLI